MTVAVAVAVKKREMDDNTKKIGQLFWRLNARDVSEGVVPKLIQLCQAIDAADWHTANHIQVSFQHCPDGMFCTAFSVQLLVILSPP